MPIVCLLLLFGFTSWNSALRASGFEGTFHFVIGDTSRPVSSGKVWVYGMGWGWMDRVQVAEIRDGIAHIRFDISDFPFMEYNGEPTAEKLLVAIELADGVWYRGPDFPPQGKRKQVHLPVREFIRGFGEYFGQLGRVDSPQDEMVTMILPQQVERRITLLREDGSPVSGLQVPIDLYVTELNHCGVHQGLRTPAYDGQRVLALETTDALGQVVFRSQPGVSLYLDVNWWPRVLSADSQWIWRRERRGIRTDLATEIEIRSQWQPGVNKTVTLEIRNQQGRPAVGHRVFWRVASDECGANGQIDGPSGPEGRVSLTLPGEATGEIVILKRESNEDETWSQRTLRKLTEDERGRLLRDGQLTVTLKSAASPEGER